MTKKTGVAAIDNTDAFYIRGSDECGYGAWAGPLVVCAAIVPREWSGNNDVTDSKVLTEKARQDLAVKYMKTVTWAIVSVKPTEIDAVGVWRALHAAHRKALDDVLKKHEEDGCVGGLLTVVDGNLEIEGAIALPKADLLVPAVSIASILGKVARDKFMEKEAERFPGYNFAKNKGYGTPDHQEGLVKLGVCEIHRKSYAPVARLVKKQEVMDQPTEMWAAFEDDE